jgi:outer membrane biosynthesis protein TonB
LKKPAGSVQFLFYKQKTKKTEPNRNRQKTEPNLAKPEKPSQNRAKPKKPSKTGKTEPKPEKTEKTGKTEPNRFEPVFALKNRTEPNRNRSV